MKRKLFFYLVVVLPYFLFAQNTTYNVGTSKVSIEPDNSVFSLTLGGYGAPRDGRFSITWIEQGETPEVINITGIGNDLFAITNTGEIIKKEITKSSSLWKTVGKAGDIKKIAGLKGILYGVTAEGHLFKSNLKKIKWQQVNGIEDVQGICASNDRLYATTKQGELLESIPGKKSIVWKNIGKANNELGLAAHGERIYSLSNDYILYKKNNDRPETPWSRMGYKNGVTYNIDLKQIAIAGDRFYALDEGNKLYIAEHKSKGNLYTNAIAINKDDETVVLVSVDLTGFDYTLSQKVKNEIAKKRGLPAEAIIINASHSHFTPIVQAWTTWGEFAQCPDSIYLNEIVIKNVIKGIEDALDNMKESTISFTRTKSVIGGNRALSGEDALYDPSVDILNIESVDRKEHDVFFLANCHPVFRNEGEEGFTLSANFPGVAKEMIEEKANVTHAVFFQGCAGDINPLHGDHVKSGTILATDVMNALEGDKDQVSGAITCALDSILIPVNPWEKSRVEVFKADNMGQEGNVEAEKNVRWANMMLSYYENGNMPKYMPIYIQTINIGNWKLVGLSREVVTKYGLAIKDLWPDKHVTVAGYCNDISSYLPCAAHIRAQNYEGFNSFLWYGQPDVFPENILDIVVERIKSNND